MANRTGTKRLARNHPDYLAKFASQFWSNVDSSGGDVSCWIWKGFVNKDGYGIVKSELGKQEGAHRVAYRLAKGGIPDGTVVRHVVCDNPTCVNPAHLIVGSHADNVADRVAKNRSAKGVRHGRTKLSEIQVQAIRKLSSGGWPANTIAAAFGIDASTARAILAGRIWADLPYVDLSLSPHSPHEENDDRRNLLADKVHPAGFEPATFGSVD